MMARSRVRTPSASNGALARPRGSRFMAKHLAGLGIDGVRAGLLRELTDAETFKDMDRLAAAAPGQPPGRDRQARTEPDHSCSTSTPATIRPRYRAGITFFMPGLALTKDTPMIDAMIETPPSTSG